ncbi:MAG: hypothetical protein C4530_13085 [Desulfobacteraceae bacterium]|nr:MAG: hypothetical protein C4530_13085 [Desulfobacteraceae bacterium]
MVFHDAYPALMVYEMTVSKTRARFQIIFENILYIFCSDKSSLLFPNFWTDAGPRSETSIRIEAL